MTLGKYQTDNKKKNVFLFPVGECRRWKLNIVSRDCQLFTDGLTWVWKNSWPSIHPVSQESKINRKEKKKKKTSAVRQQQPSEMASLVFLLFLPNLFSFTHGRTHSTKRSLPHSTGIHLTSSVNFRLVSICGGRRDRIKTSGRINNKKRNLFFIYFDELLLFIWHEELKKRKKSNILFGLWFSTFISFFFSWRDKKGYTQTTASQTERRGSEKENPTERDDIYHLTRTGCVCIWGRFLS
jgi:hypothetical protein